MPVKPRWDALSPQDQAVIVVRHMYGVLGGILANPAYRQELLSGSITPADEEGMILAMALALCEDHTDASHDEMAEAICDVTGEWPAWSIEEVIRRIRTSGGLDNQEFQRVRKRVWLDLASANARRKLGRAEVRQAPAPRRRTV